MRNHDAASYASSPALSRGRLISEPPSPTRADFQRDRDRIIHSTAFRRLAHKTQVFVPLAGDHFRTRLTHTIEVSQIARALARGLGLNEDLTEAIALAHDLGHTPFGHAGEDALDPLMAPFGGFDHNAQALRIVTQLERRYARFDGLNLTWETLEGIVKHNGPLTPRADAASDSATMRAVAQKPAQPILAFDRLWRLDLDQYASAEAQCAALADDIAYNAHDIDDGLRAELFAIEDLSAKTPLLKDICDEIAATYGALDRGRLIHEIGRRVITRLVEDALTESARRLAPLTGLGPAAIRAADGPLVAFSPGMASAEREVKTFLFAAMYRHPQVLVFRDGAQEVVTRLFAHYRADRARLPLEWAAYVAGARDDGARARVVADYLAGMTDRYAVSEYRRLIDPHFDIGRGDRPARCEPSL